MKLFITSIAITYYHHFHNHISIFISIVNLLYFETLFVHMLWTSHLAEKLSFLKTGPSKAQSLSTMVIFPWLVANEAVF